MNDPLIRDSYIQYLYAESSDYNPNKDLLISEMGLCRGASIVDLAVINGKLHGYEIKSDVDSLVRLPHQISMYEKFFSYLTIVTTNKHAEVILKGYPAWLGVSVAKEKDGKITFSHRRKAKLNRNASKTYISQLLWKQEAISILTKHGIHKGIKGLPKKMLWDMVTEKLTFKELISETKICIANRSNWQVVRIPA